MNLLSKAAPHFHAIKRKIMINEMLMNFQWTILSGVCLLKRQYLYAITNFFFLFKYISVFHCVLFIAERQVNALNIIKLSFLVSRLYTWKCLKLHGMTIIHGIEISAAELSLVACGQYDIYIFYSCIQHSYQVQTMTRPFLSI